MNNHTHPKQSAPQLKKIPSSSFLRMWALGSSQARIAGHYFAYATRKHFVSDDKKQLLENEFHLKSALQLVGTMGYLRGAIMKIGQMLANFPQILPQELVEVFESLQFQAPPMHYSLIREIFLDEFGKEPEEIFASFSRQAFAAASLGQVHRAKLHSGKDVVVKVQYPNIGATIKADMKSFEMLLQGMRFRKDFKYLCGHIHDARSVFLKEIDYLSESLFMEKNRQLFHNTQIVVPAHYPEYTSKCVLTMEYLPGRHLQDFLRQRPTRAQQNHFAKLISHSLITSWFRCKTIYADLHPGNYIMMDDGRLGFIDFGCHRQFEEERWKLQMAAEIAMFNDDKEALNDFLTKLSMRDTPDDLDEKWAELIMQQIRWVVAPVVAKKSFDFANQDYVADGVLLFKEFLRKGYARTDPFYNWSNRAIIGHRALMYRLRAKFDYSSLYLKEMKKYL